MIAKDKIFREYDIRGEVGTDFDADFAYSLGQAYAQFVKDEVGKDELTVAVGLDCRLTSPELKNRLMSGICSQGVNVISCPMGPTPQLYYTVFARDLDGGIQVTASHNPGPDNGFKMMAGKRTMSGQDIQVLRELVGRGIVEPCGDGEIEEFAADAAYLSELVERSKSHVNPNKKIKVVVDAGNGAGGIVGPKLLKELGCEVVELYTEPDGTFPNHHPDPTVLKNIAELRERVVAEKADVGIAWDGDADRIGVVDEKGEVIWGDMLLVVYGQQLLKEVEKPIIIGDVKCSEIMFSRLADKGAETVMWKTGHSLMKSKLKELNAHLAGEMSGHMFFNHRFYGFDDAIHSAARLIEILSNADCTISELLADVPKSISTPEIRLECPDEKKFVVSEKAQEAFAEYEVNTLDGVRITFPSGWGLVRASNTQPALVMRFEADSEANLAEYKNLVETRIQDLMSQL